MTTCPACGTTLITCHIDTFCPNKECIYDGSFDGEALRWAHVSVADPKHVESASYILREWQAGRRPGASLEDIATEIVESTCGKTHRQSTRVPANLAEARAHWQKNGAIRVGDTIELAPEYAFGNPWQVVELYCETKGDPGMAIRCKYVGTNPEQPTHEVQVPLAALISLVRAGSL